MQMTFSARQTSWHKTLWALSLLIVPLVVFMFASTTFAASANNKCEPGESGAPECNGICAPGEDGSNDCNNVCVTSEQGSSDCNTVCENGEGGSPDCDSHCQQGEDGSVDCDSECNVGDESGTQDCDGSCLKGTDEECSPDCDPYGACAAGNLNLSSQDLKTVIFRVINMILGLLGTIAVVLILIAGFMWMTAAGNDDRIGTAKKIMLAGVAGLAIILAAYSISNFVIKNLQEAIQE